MADHFAIAAGLLILLSTFSGLIVKLIQKLELFMNKEVRRCVHCNTPETKDDGDHPCKRGRIRHAFQNQPDDSPAPQHEPDSNY